MTNKEKLVWRLSKLPSVEEILNLVKDKIITQEEAKEILFSLENQKERDIESFKSEIKFLRELVEKLSENKKSIIVDVIKIVDYPYRRFSWYQPYINWTLNPTSTYPGTTSSNFTSIQTY